MSSVWNRRNIDKSLRKSLCQEAICAKTSFELANLFDGVYVNIPAVRKNATRHTPVRIHKYSIRKCIITMPSVWKRTNILKSIRKSISQEAICTKTCFQLANLYESILIRRPAVRKRAARRRPVRKHILYENVWSRYLLYENVQAFEI